MIKFCILFMALLIPISAHASILTVDELIVNGGNSKAITIKPTGSTEYAPLKWLDQAGNNVAQIVCHEQQTLGDWHNHCTWYTALADRTQRTGRMDLQFGVDFAKWNVESAYVIFEKGAYIVPIMKSPNGTRYRLLISDTGVITTQLVQ